MRQVKMKRKRLDKLSPLVTVIVPVYNSVDELECCVESILQQSYQNIELILVDDGSTDMSGKICDQYSKKYSSVQVVHQENQGEMVAKNTGLERATGRYIQFVDNDDWLEPDMTEKLVLAAEHSSADMVVCSYRRIYDNDYSEDVVLGITGMQPPYRQLMEFARGVPDAMLRMGAPWNRLLRRDILEKHHLRFENDRTPNIETLFACEYVRCIRNCYFLDEPLYNYRMPDGRKTSTTRYRPKAFEMTNRVYGMIESIVGSHLTPCEVQVFNRHYLDKVVISIKMLCRSNTVFTAAELRDKVKHIIDNKMVREKLETYSLDGSQSNEVIQMMAEHRDLEVYEYAIQAARQMESRWG